MFLVVIADQLECPAPVERFLGVDIGVWLRREVLDAVLRDLAALSLDEFVHRLLHQFDLNVVSADLVGRETVCIFEELFRGRLSSALPELSALLLMNLFMLVQGVVQSWAECLLEIWP